MKLTPRDRLIVALDVDSAARALELVKALSGTAGMFKIGSQLFTAEGPPIVSAVVEQGEKVFLDLKFHDIPNTVAASCREATRLGVSLMTLHASGGSRMLREAAEAVSRECRERNLTRPQLLAITLLTSLGVADLREIHIRDRFEEVVPGLAELAMRAGLDGVVTSPQEALLVRHRVGREDFLVVTPGVRPSWAVRNDQQRVLTPREALQEGADYIVVGRPIIAASDPREAAAAVVEEIRGFVVEERNEAFRRRFV
ncbi:MAG: orotidine-5'-phosphate decarboxylase [Acidobacteria bacterium]|nr:orotidine-5'-phosphate decarboxylase [Acidobacteriota bacterium]